MRSRGFSIRRKVQTVVLLISAIALLLATAVGLFSLLNIRTRVLEGCETLGENAASSSEDALILQMENSLLDIVRSKAELADSALGKFAGYADMFARYTETLYEKPGSFVLADVLPPDKANEGSLAMQRYLANAQVPLASVAEEIALLGNLEHVFDPIIRENEEMITTIYVGTESGFLLSYDASSGLGDTGAAEEYYDFDGSSWYTMAKQAGAPVFTDTYLDSYGRGLTISCAAPFYSEGAFMGVVCMDILVTDLNNSIIDINIGENAFAFLVNAAGSVIASPMQAPDSEDYVNILEDESIAAHAVASSIMSGETGVTLSGDIYYAFTPVTSASWTLAVYVPAADIIQPAVEIRDIIALDTDATSNAMRSTIMAAIWIFSLTFIIIMITVALFADGFSKRLTRPLLALQSDVNIISRGDLAHRAAVQTSDEIGDLAGAFNNMTTSLQTYIANLTSVTAEKERIGAELDVATKIQASMLPCIFPAFPERAEFDIFASMQPAKEVGGDFYDFFLIDDNTLAVVMADVSGKGVPAALFMVIAKTLIKNNAQYGKSPRDVFETVNNLLCENNEADMFVTAFMGYLDIATGTFTYVNAGHNPPLLRRDGRFDWLRSRPGFVLAGMENISYKETEITLARGDEIFLYTDGVTEAVNREEELFSDPRLLETVNNCPNLPLEEFTAYIKKEIEDFADGAEQADDITLLTMKYIGGDAMKQLDIKASLDNLPAVLEFVERELEAADCPMKLQTQIAIAVEEIFVNIARYAYAPVTGEVVVRVSVGDEVRIEFEDNGKPYNPLEKEDPDITADAEDREIGGLGIFMVKKSMDAVEYRHEGNRNILLIRKSLR